MSTPTREEVIAEQDALITRYRTKILKRFNWDIIEDFGNDLYEWSEIDFEDYITELLQTERNEGAGL